MDTIAINAGEALNEDGRDKKNVKINNTTKAAIATGAAVLGAGVAAKSITDTLDESSENEVSTIADGHSQSEESVHEIGSTDDVVAEVNPDDVMLEESVSEPSSETDMITEATTQLSEEGPYRPFAGNDNIEGDILPEPQPEESLIAENEDVDVIAGEDSPVDMICGMPETEAGIIEEQIQPESALYADNGSDFNDSDIQSDLMA